MTDIVRTLSSAEVAAGRAAASVILKTLQKSPTADT